MKNYTLQAVHYTWQNALLWGNFFEHCKEAKKGNLCHRIVHSLIALTQVWPILSQISSIAEKLIVTYCIKPSNPDLDPARVSKEKPPVADKMPMPALVIDPKQTIAKEQIISNVQATQDLPKDNSNPSIESDVPAVEVLGPIFKNAIPKNPPLIVQNRYHQKEDENTMQYLKRIFEDTLIACKQGYQLADNTIVTINNKPMLQETVSYGQLEALPSVEKPYNSEFNVIAQDTLQVLLKRKAEGGNPVGINMANRYHAGGGVAHGCTAQEEALCRSSNHILGLQTQPYPLALTGGIYTPHVQIFRNDKKQGFSFMVQPQEVALVAVAAFDLREGSSERKNLKLPNEGTLTLEQLKNNAAYVENSKDKIRNMLRIMALKGHSQLVLGALGCGAFQNPPALIAQFFKEVFNEQEFKGRFERVDFAILKMSLSDQNNIDEFSKICGELNSN